jgi:hypothetical protein
MKRTEMSQILKTHYATPRREQQASLGKIKGTLLRDASRLQSLPEEEQGSEREHHDALARWLSNEEMKLRLREPYAR